MTAGVSLPVPAIRERPILLSGPMVRAILDGRKTQTRRVITPTPPDATTDLANIHKNEWACIGNNGPNRVCHYGEPGDRLWVRETFAGPDHIGDGDQGIQGFGIEYKADGAFLAHGDCGCDGACSGVLIVHPWKPSIHMPRWASRLTLEITGVRAERVQDISEEDAEAEGAPRGWFERDTLDGPEVVPTDHRSGFGVLWDKLNAKRGYGWNANPWVWVIEFRRVEA